MDEKGRQIGIGSNSINDRDVEEMKEMAIKNIQEYEIIMKKSKLSEHQQMSTEELSNHFDHIVKSSKNVYTDYMKNRLKEWNNKISKIK